MKCNPAGTVPAGPVKPMMIDYYEIKRGEQAGLRTGEIVERDENKKRILVKHGDKTKWIRESQVKGTCNAPSG